MPEQGEIPINPETLAGKNILVVDDEEMISGITKRFLQKAGALVQTAINGRVALDLIKEGVFDLIITDNSMPKMTGCQLIEELRRNPETAKLPIILTSGDLFNGLTPPQIQEKAISLGADAGIPKPWSNNLVHVKLAARLLSERKS